jgi:hypothetical protein
LLVEGRTQKKLKISPTEWIISEKKLENYEKKEKMDEVNNESRESRYNSALQQLYRLDGLWNKAHKLALEGNLREYKFVLDRIWIELSPDADSQEIKKRDKFNKILNQILVIEAEESKKDESKDTSEPVIRKGIEAKKRKIRNVLYKWAQKYEIFLRRLLNRQGKGTSYRDLSEEEID